MSYCKNCKFFVRYDAKSFDAVTLTKDRGQPICGKTLLTEYNCLGDKVWRRYGVDEICEECGTVLKQAGRLQYRVCLDKNKGGVCREYEPTWWYKLLNKILRKSK